MKTGYKVGDVMTQNPIVCSQDTVLSDLAAKMGKHHVGAMLIVDDKKPLGIITEQDIVRKTVAVGKNPLEMTAKDIMATNLTTIAPRSDLRDAIELMGQCNIRHLPVVEEGNYVGLLTSKDALKIQPHLFDLMAHTIELKEESRKPLRSINPDEGMCNLCGEYAVSLIRRDDVSVCSSCAALEEDDEE